MTRRHEPSEDDRRTVRALSGYGVPHEDIATHMDMDAKTLRKHYRRELDRGTIEANAKVTQTLFTMATVDKNVAAVIFWMKARAGWREKPLPDEDGVGNRLTVVIRQFASVDDQVARHGHPAVRTAPKLIARDIDHE